jgi:restriction endonuclease Mrr
LSTPKYDEIMKPMLRRVADGEPHKVDDLVAPLASDFTLTPEELNEQTEGGDPPFKKRVWWARTP